VLIKRFIENSLILEADQSIKMRAAEIRRIYSLKLPDALIAASPLTFNLTLP
jgi:predicted nucleic acid-binding protein